MAWKNKLYFGDNLQILREHIDSESVDLVYLDPPFNSNANYNVLFAESSKKKSVAQIQAFSDTWHWANDGPDSSEMLFHDLVKTGSKPGELLASLRKFLGTNDMMAYLVMMAPRLIELHRVLKPTGSLYLHCDPTASHYLKLLLDAIFGTEHYQNEIVWKRTTTHNDSKTWSRVADIIFFYTKSDEFTWNVPRAKHSDKYIETKYRYEDGDGRLYQLHDMTSPNPRPNMMYEWKGFPYPPKGWRFELSTMQELDAAGRIWYPTNEDGSFDTTKRPRIKRYLDETDGGGIMGTIWTDIFPINSQAQEKLGYPTQKPLALLDRILSASSNKNDVVLDPFCGCGTTVDAAQKLDRRWIGIDITHLAISLIKNRLHTGHKLTSADYEVSGAPTDLETARALAETNRYQFEWWALGLVEAQPASDKKKGADKGIDGKIVFFDDESGQPKYAVVQVKSGHVNRGMVSTLNSDRQREKAEIGLLVTLEEPTKPMIEEASSAGIYEPQYYAKHKFPRIQILTIGELLAGHKRAQIPEFAPRATFKAAPRHRSAPKEKQVGLFAEG
jgi:site-specific DNA-methyltransferase (adenine-specific)